MNRLSVWGKNSKEREGKGLLPLPSSPLDQRPVHRLLEWLCLTRHGSSPFYTVMRPFKGGGEGGDAVTLLAISETSCRFVG